MMTRKARHRIDVRTIKLWRDIKGYEIVDNPSPNDGLARFGTYGRQIVGRSGWVVPAIYDADRQNGLWRKASQQVKDLNGLCEFMSEYGPLGSSAILLDNEPGQLKVFRVGSRQERKYGSFSFKLTHPRSVDERTGQEFIDTIQTLAQFVESFDQAGFFAAIGGTLTSKVNLKPMQGEATWAIELPTLLSLIRYQMWNQFGADKQALFTSRTCENCQTLITVGGRRGASLRIDARFCSSRCRSAFNIREKRRAIASRT